MKTIMTWHDLRIEAFICSFPTYMHRSQTMRGDVEFHQGPNVFNYTDRYEYTTFPEKI